MRNLIKKKCIPCEGGVKPFTRAEAEKYMSEVPGWSLDPEAKKISKEFRFKDFIGSVNFMEKVAELAESEGHHPDIHMYYNRVVLELTTHAIQGLTENDFIVAAKIEAMRGYQ